MQQSAGCDQNADTGTVKERCVREVDHQIHRVIGDGDRESVGELGCGCEVDLTGECQDSAETRFRVS